MAVRKRKWVTSKGEQREAWIVDYADHDGRHIETFERKKDADARHAAVARTDLLKFFLSLVHLRWATLERSLPWPALPLPRLENSSNCLTRLAPAGTHLSVF
jgi:hypothetical protein